MAKQQKEFQEQMEQMIVQKQADRSALKSSSRNWKLGGYKNITQTCSLMVHLCSLIPQTQSQHNTIQWHRHPPLGPWQFRLKLRTKLPRTIPTPTPSDTTRHPIAYADTKPDFEHDPELDSEDQNILTIETTDTLDNSLDKQHNSDPTFDNVHNSSIGDCTDIKQTIDNSDIGDPNESKTETINDNMQDQTSNIDNDDQDNSEFESTEIIQTDNNTLDFNSPIDFNDHNSSMVTQAETDNSHKESKPMESEDESDPKSFESGTNLDYCFQEAMRLQHKQEIRAIDFGPNLHTQVSECADINAIRSNHLTCFNCKSPDHLGKDCLEPNKMQQPQRNNRQNSSIESAIQAPTQTLKSLLSNQNSHGYSKPKQPFHHKRVKPHARPSFKPTYRPHNNKGQYFRNNSKYQKQTAHTNAIEDYEAMYLNMCENFRAKLPASKPIPLFSFG